MSRRPPAEDAPPSTSMSGDGPTVRRQGERARTMAVWCPEWPVAAWGVPPDVPAAVLVGNRVIAATPAARAEGVGNGLRRRDAQARCPALAVHERDVDREARLFEPVVAAVSAFTPLVEITWPGSCAFPTRGPSRYFGGDQALGLAVAAAADSALCRSVEGWRGQVGVANGTFAAALAARSARPGAPVVVEVGATPTFLAPFPVEVLERPALTDVLARLGLSSLGAFAALDTADVIGRFGREGIDAHRLAAGNDPRPADVRPPPADLTAVVELDPPVEVVDQAAFAAKMLADRLTDALEGSGLSCLRLAIEAETCYGETLLRYWRHEGALSAAAMAERVRWQLEGWLVGTVADQPTGGLIRLALTPDQVVPAAGRQLRFWGGESREAERAARAVARLAGMLGPEAVRVVEPRGGRGPSEQFALLPATAVDLLGRGRQEHARSISFPADGRAGRRSGGPVPPPWPGRLPSPSPAVVSVAPQPVEVVDREGAPVRVDGRGAASAAPAWLVVPGAGGRRAIVAWAGPWPLEERWWDSANQRRQARFQVVLDDGSAHLLALERRAWQIVASYE